MSFSITVTLDAFGLVRIDAVEQAGGCPFTIGERRARGAGGDLVGVAPGDARDRFAGQIEWSPSADDSWRELREPLVHAVHWLAACLPPPEVFDEDGRPRRTRPSSHDGVAIEYEEEDDHG